MTAKRTRTKKSTPVSRRSAQTKVSAIEKEYGVDLGVRSDMKLGNYLKLKGYGSLARMLS